MHRIYGGATSVTCWLGTPSQGLMRVMSWAADLNFVRANEENQNGSYSRAKDQNATLQRHDAAETLDLTQATFESIESKVSEETESLTAKRVLEEVMRRT